MRDIDKELGLDEALAVESSSVNIRVESRRYKKNVTVLTGFDSHVDLALLAKTLKQSLGTGGTSRDGTIELQGDHHKEVRVWLEKKGYPVS